MKENKIVCSISYYIAKTHWGFFLYSMSRCIDCKHKIDDTSHERCHTHADCAQDRLYYGGFCGICQSLWARSREYKSDYDDAKAAYDILFTWINGFGKNSKGRAPGQDFFSDANERQEFEALRKILKPRKRSASRDSSFASSISSKRVSIERNYCYIGKDFISHIEYQVLV